MNKWILDGAQAKIINTDGDYIATVAYESIDGSGCTYGKGDKLINAQLIARAPELLEENESLKKDYEWMKLQAFDKAKEVQKLEASNRELLEALKILLETGDNVSLFKDNAEKLIAKHKL